eukprot:scaffold26097_cov96-Isochrysis_galbana.AAC.1
MTRCAAADTPRTPQARHCRVSSIRRSPLRLARALVVGQGADERRACAPSPPCTRRTAARWRAPRCACQRSP